LVQEFDSEPRGTFSEAIIASMRRAREFEEQDDAMVMLKQRFLQECPQQVKQQILQRMVPESMELFAHVLRRYAHRPGAHVGYLSVGAWRGSSPRLHVHGGSARVRIAPTRIGMLFAPPPSAVVVDLNVSRIYTFS